MNLLKKTIGDNIKEARKEKGLSQEVLGEMCGFSNTTLSSYENGKREPSTKTIARIAKQLGVSIEQLLYGTEDKSFIVSAPDEGKKIVNAVYYLWENGVISYYENNNQNQYYDYDYSEKKNKRPTGIYLTIIKHKLPIKRLLLSLDEFRDKEKTYPNPEKYLDMLLSSVANEINAEIEGNN